MCKYTVYIAHIVHRVLKGHLLTSALCIVPVLCKQGCPNLVIGLVDVYTMYIAHIGCSAGF